MNERTKICNPILKLLTERKKNTQSYFPFLFLSIESGQKALEFNCCNADFIKISFVFSPLFCLEENAMLFLRAFFYFHQSFQTQTQTFWLPKIFEVISQLDDYFFVDIWNLSLSKCFVDLMPKFTKPCLLNSSLMRAEHLQIWLTCLFCCSTGQWLRWSSGRGTSSLQSSQTILTPGGRVWSLDPSWHSGAWPGASGTDQDHDSEVLKVFLLNWQLNNFLLDVRYVRKREGSVWWIWYKLKVLKFYLRILPSQTSLQSKLGMNRKFYIRKNIESTKRVQTFDLRVCKVSTHQCSGRGRLSLSQFWLLLTQTWLCCQKVEEAVWCTGLRICNKYDEMRLNFDKYWLE